jgi:hypothetical protein
MKRVLLSFSMLISTVLVHGQFMDLGIKSGMNYTNDPARIFQSDLGGDGWNTSIGGYAEFHFGRLSIQPDFMFTSTEYIAPDAFGIDDIALFDVNRFDVPLMFTYEFFNFLSLEAGPNFYNIKDNEDEQLFRLKNLQKEFALGASAEIKRFTVGARVINDFSDLLGADENTYQLTIAYKLF